MAGDPNAAARSAAVQKALSVVNLGVQAAAAYKRPDLASRLGMAKKRLLDPVVPRVRGGRVQAGQVARWSTRCSTRPSARSTTTSPPPRRPRCATARSPRPRCCSTARATASSPGRDDARTHPRGHPHREGRRVRHRGGQPGQRAAGAVGRGGHPPQAAGRRARASSTPPASAGWARPTAPPPSAPCRWPTR